MRPEIIRVVIWALIKRPRGATADRHVTGGGGEGLGLRGGPLLRAPLETRSLPPIPRELYEGPCPYRQSQSQIRPSSMLIGLQSSHSVSSHLPFKPISGRGRGARAPPIAIILVSRIQEVQLGGGEG